MHTYDHETHATSGGRTLAEVLTDPSNAVARLFRDIARRQTERRGVATLLSLDDHLLRDIGVTRGNAEWTMRTGRR